VGFAKDYGINGFLPKGSPPIIPFPLARLPGFKICFLFSLFLLKIINQGKAAKGKANNKLFIIKHLKLCYSQED